MSVFNQFRDRLGNGKPWRKVRLSERWMRNPGWYNRLHNTRRRRAADLIGLRLVTKGVDPDALSWRRDKKPSVYYW